MATVELRSESMGREVTWWKKFTKTYECPVLLCPEDEGGFSAHALTLPGAVSEGESESEALENIAEAICLLIEGYLEKGGAIPWEKVEVDEVPKAAKQRWILVNA